MNIFETMEKSKATLMVAVAVVLFIFSNVAHVRSDASDHRYKAGEQVPLYANKVGPFHNPRFVISHSFLACCFDPSIFCSFLCVSITLLYITRKAR